MGESAIRKVCRDRRLNFEFIKESFRIRGYELLIGPLDYRNNSQKLQYTCLRHKEDGVKHITWSDFNSGKGCAKCGRDKMVSKQRLNFSTVIRGFRERGYILLSKKSDYRNGHAKLYYLCPRHLDEGILSIAWSDLNSGKGCGSCGLVRTADALRNDIQYWRDIFSEKGCTLITTHIKNNKDKVKFTCDKHPDVIQESSVYHFREGSSCCHICGKEASSGENHYFWKGGITSESSKIRSSPEYILWKVAVFTRDMRTCQCCGNRVSGDLNAHHIKPFSIYPKLRLVVDNGITLCKYCHDTRYAGSFHNIYGTRNNTEAQLHEYLAKRKEELTHAN